jgi:transcriptional regulator with XRE-family HTH domain/KaiC/GvpD/RAD55 family RecA-like ATPase
MHSISTGIKGLDNLIDYAHIGDNVVWEVEAGTSEDLFINNFVHSSLKENQDVIYVSFNRSPESIILNLGIKDNPKKLTILDCFTSGKGKSDRTFLKFYDAPQASGHTVIKVNNPGDISFFSETINSFQDKLPEGVRYIFDSLTGMQDLWGDENSTYKFFTYMCPRLYDLRTVAYWMLEKDAHSQTFKANLRHITQVVIELYKKSDKLFLKALKLSERSNREAFKPHAYGIEGTNVFVVHEKKGPSINIGNRIRDRRITLSMSQKDLADRIGMTSSFISQIENDQISPSLNSFLQIASALGMNPADLMKKDRQRDNVNWLVKGNAIKKKLFEKQKEYSIFTIVSADKVSVYKTVIRPRKKINKHFLHHKKEEFIHVMNGTVSVKIDNTEKEITTGDSIYLRDSLPSLWNNMHDDIVELMVISIN